MPRKVVVASANEGKLRELAAMLVPMDLEVVPQARLEVQPIEETGVTFVENALLKARHACRATGLPALADDSGIAVDVLGGAPGIYSARYAGSGSTDAENVQKLLAELQGRAEAERDAHYECVLVYMRAPLDPSPIVCQATWSGRVLSAARGRGGFGYDPVFFVPTFDCTVAELSAETKNQVSHRARAMHQLAERLDAVGVI